VVMEARTAGLVYALVVASGSVRAAEPAGTPVPRVRILSRLEAAAVTAAVQGAAKRLWREDCRRILTDFSDSDGRVLLTNLEALGATPETYLGLIGFYDGRAHRRCLNPDVVALTGPGSRAVHVCPQFVQLWLREPALAEILILHEALHTLGLGENPPASTVITARVAARCGG
jgi:hypothetical protein